MTDYLYKVSAPRDDPTFYPSTFWHTSDWESSTTRHRCGYIQDELLYVGDFDEINIHLFPRVRTVRVRAIDADVSALRSLGLRCEPGKAAHIFARHSHREEIEAFCPTIFKFHRDGFVRVRKGEYISREPRRAISAETIPIVEATARWNVQPCYVDDLDNLIRTLRQAGIYFDEQT